MLGNLPGHIPGHMRGHMHGHTRKHAHIMIIGILGLFIVFSLLVMLLWNAIMPDLTGCGSLNYIQAAGLLALCRILFGGLGAGFKAKGMRDHFRDMSPEQRETLFRNIHGPNCKKPCHQTEKQPESTKDSPPSGSHPDGRAE